MFNGMRSMVAALVAASTGLPDVPREFVPRDVQNVPLPAMPPRRAVSGAFGRRHRGPHNPAGTKLVRSFIRRSERESTYWRKLYAEMTGHQYEGTSR